MPHHKELPSIEYLNECFVLNIKHGILIWQVRPLDHFKSEHGMTIWNRRYPGIVSGTLSKKGYQAIMLDRRLRSRARIIFKMFNGIDPDGDVDHRDLDTVNDRPYNLRVADDSQNKANRYAPSNNTSGFKGVSFNKASGLWVANVCFRGHQEQLGCFSSREEAAAAYAKGAVATFGEFARFDQREAS